jgi:NAD(P)-dependent dehydrogenase (short-subunit alcohol dehydrogenase family)
MAELRFDGRAAVITGAGRGLGREYALLLASRGARIVVNDNGSNIKGEAANEGPAHDVVREIEAAGGEAVACTESVATPEGGRAIVQAALDAFGGVDILIHNAGNVRYGGLDEMPQEDFEAVIDVHLKGAFHVVRAAFPHMSEAGYGRIVLTSSVGGLYGNQSCVNYGMSKAGMIGLANVAGIEGADRGIKVNLIVPAAVTRMAEGLDTSLYPPMGPELVAPVVGWLAHEDCTISGEMLISVAGRVARAFVAETEGVYRPSWTIESVGEEMDAIRDPARQWVFAPVPSGQRDHLARSFEMARQGAGSK